MAAASRRGPSPENRVRAGKVNLQDAYARIEHGEAWLVGAHIAPWDTSGIKFNHHFTLSADGRRLVVVSALDNLLKGAATQALQNLNLAFGLPEGTGIPVDVASTCGTGEAA